MNDMLTQLYVGDDNKMYHWDNLMIVKEFVIEHNELSSNYPFDDVKTIIDNISETTNYSEEALENIIKELHELSKPIYSKNNTDSEISIKEKNIVLTGEFARGSKDTIKAELKSLGANVKTGVSSKTNILIVGSLGSQEWICGSYGGKIKNAMELNAKGANILVISETDFYKRLGENNE